MVFSVHGELLIYKDGQKIWQDGSDLAFLLQGLGVEFNVVNLKSNQDFDDYQHEWKDWETKYPDTVSVIEDN